MSISWPVLILLAHCAATFYMTGVIWFVQLSQYPLFRLVAPESMTRYATTHAQWTTWVVGPPMLLEALTFVYLISYPPAGTTTTFWLVGAALLLIIWGATAFLSVPCHTILAQGHDPAVIERLIATNWVRTLAWTLRSLLILGLLYRLLLPKAH